MYSCYQTLTEDIILDFIKPKKVTVRIVEDSGNQNLDSTDYLEEGYNSEMSDIMNEIMGISGSSCKYYFVPILYGLKSAV